MNVYECNTRNSFSQSTMKHLAVRILARFHNWDLKLCVNPNTYWPNLKCFAVLFLKIQLMFTCM